MQFYSAEIYGSILQFVPQQSLASILSFLPSYLIDASLFYCASACQLTLRCAVEDQNLAAVKKLLGQLRYLKQVKLSDELLSIAVRQGDLSIVRCLLKDGRVDPSNIYLFFNACRLGDVAVVRQLLKDPRVIPSPHVIKVKDPRHGTWECEINAVRVARRFGQEAVVRCLLEHPKYLRTS